MNEAGYKDDDIAATIYAAIEACPKCAALTEARVDRGRRCIASIPISCGTKDECFLRVARHFNMVAEKIGL